jgi:hypothetical protein
MSEGQTTAGTSEMTADTCATSYLMHQAQIQHKFSEHTRTTAVF